MLFRRGKRSEDRLKELRARVEALRALDDAGESRFTLDDFLEGDDVVTARGPDIPYRTPAARPQPAVESSEGHHSDDEVDLAVELEKYLAREADRKVAPPVVEAEPEAPKERAAPVEWDRWPDDDSTPPPPSQTF